MAWRRTAIHLGDKIHLTELAGTDVYRQHQAAGIRPPLPRLDPGTGGFHHPLSNGEYQPRLFRQRDELRGRHHAVPGMNPPDQCLGPDRLPQRIHLNLVIQMELPFFQRPVRSLMTSCILGSKKRNILRPARLA